MKLVDFCRGNLFLTLAIAGSVVRLLFSLQAHIWHQAYDQIVWQLSVDEMLMNDHWRYKQLIHYPFEGGTAIFSLLAVFFENLRLPGPALSLAAAAADLLIRFFQMKITEVCFGRWTAVGWGVWSIFAVPLLLPWSFAFFGLHYVNSIFPFLMLYVSRVSLMQKWSPFWPAILVSAAIYFSYDNILLVLIYPLWVLLSGGKNPRVRLACKYFVILFIALLPHIIIRVFVDHGFPGEAMAGLIKRERDWSETSFAGSSFNLVHFFYRSLPGAVFLHEGRWPVNELLKIILLIYLGVAIYMSFRKQNPLSKVSLLLVTVFVVLYCFSIFFTDKTEHLSFYLYRHFAYILPLFFVLLIHAFSEFESRRTIFIAPLLLISVFVSLDFMAEYTPPAPPSYKVVGWIAAQKFIDESETLVAMAALSGNENIPDFLFGIGWGSTAYLLKTVQYPDPVRAARLNSYYLNYDTLSRHHFKEGALHAFAPGITPILDNRFRGAVDRLPEK